MNGQAMRHQAQAVMERLKVSLPLDELVGTLPIAMRQLVAICRALAAQRGWSSWMNQPLRLRARRSRRCGRRSRLKRRGLPTVLSPPARRSDDHRRARHGLARRPNLGTYWVRDIDRRRLGELITGHVYESSIKAPFSGQAAPALEVRGFAYRANTRASTSSCIPVKSSACWPGTAGLGRLAELAL